MASPKRRKLRKLARLRIRRPVTPVMEAPVTEAVEADPVEPPAALDTCLECSSDPSSPDMRWLHCL